MIIAIPYRPGLTSERLFTIFRERLAETHDIYRVRFFHDFAVREKGSLVAVGVRVRACPPDETVFDLDAFWGRTWMTALNVLNRGKWADFMYFAPHLENLRDIIASLPELS